MLFVAAGHMHLKKCCIPDMLVTCPLLFVFLRVVVVVVVVVVAVVVAFVVLAVVAVVVNVTTSTSHRPTTTISIKRRK